MGVRGCIYANVKTFRFRTRTTVFGVGHHHGEPIQQTIRHCRLERRRALSVPGQLGVVSRLQRGRRFLHNFVAHQVLVVVFAFGSQRLEKKRRTKMKCDDCTGIFSSFLVRAPGH